MNSFPERIIDLFGSLHPLDRIQRAGYVMRGVAHPESVSAHSHFVSLLTLLFLDEHPEEYDRDKALAMALTHDLSEAKLMDIPMPSADAYLKDAKALAEQAIFEDLFSGFSPRYAEYSRELHEALTPEARLVRGLDKAQMMVKILFYERDHNGCLEEFWGNPANFRDYGVASVSELFDKICARAGRERPRP
jgi:putative hydrolase of HD superfamily